MDKRMFQREKLNNIDSIFYIQGADDCKKEFSGIATDISECGVAIKVVDEQQIEIADELQVGSVFRFTFVDEYDFFDESKLVQVEGIAKVVRKEKAPEGLFFGCEIPGHKELIGDYVTDKKIVSSMKKDEGC